jgi:hypothetical protein
MDVYDNCLSRATLKNGHVNVQWKGTDATLDFNCDCGACQRYRGAFLTFVRCDQCDAVYWLNPTVEAVKLTAKERKVVYQQWSPKEPEPE